VPQRSLFCLPRALGLIFLFEAEVRAFRRACDELRTQTRDPRVLLEPLVDALRARGLGATLMVPMPDEAVTHLDDMLRSWTVPRS